MIAANLVLKELPEWQALSKKQRRYVRENCIASLPRHWRQDLPVWALRTAVFISVICVPHIVHPEILYMVSIFSVYLLADGWREMRLINRNKDHITAFIRDQETALKLVDGQNILPSKTDTDRMSDTDF